MHNIVYLLLVILLIVLGITKLKLHPFLTLLLAAILTGFLGGLNAGTTLAKLTEREVFGELAALDPEPRVASVTALEDTDLFRINQDALYELMAEHIEVARGIIHILCSRLRGKAQEE